MDCGKMEKWKSEYSFFLFMPWVAWEIQLASDGPVGPPISPTLTSAFKHYIQCPGSHGTYGTFPILARTKKWYNINTLAFLASLYCKDARIHSKSPGFETVVWCLYCLSVVGKLFCLILKHKARACSTADVLNLLWTKCLWSYSNHNLHLFQSVSTCGYVTVSMLLF